MYTDCRRGRSKASLYCQSDESAFKGEDNGRTRGSLTTKSTCQEWFRTGVAPRPKSQAFVSFHTKAIDTGFHPWTLNPCDARRHPRIGKINGNGIGDMLESVFV